jgi:hypothetical protein
LSHDLARQTTRLFGSITAIFPSIFLDFCAIHFAYIYKMLIRVNTRLTQFIPHHELKTSHLWVFAVLAGKSSPSDHADKSVRVQKTPAISRRVVRVMHIQFQENTNLKALKDKRNLNEKRGT